jgi:hypothetical protein
MPDHVQVRHLTKSYGSTVQVLKSKSKQTKSKASFKDLEHKNEFQ